MVGSAGPPSQALKQQLGRDFLCVKVNLEGRATSTYWVTVTSTQFRVLGFKVQGLGVRSPKLQNHGINKLEVRRPAKVGYWVGIPSTLRLGRID